MNSEKAMKWIVYLFLVSFVFCVIYLHIYNQEVLSEWCTEDGIVESITTICYFIASFIFIFACKTQRFRNIWYWFFALLFFFIAGEEISWGQRFFNITTPEMLKNINVQQEVNIHNIEGIHGIIRRWG